MRKTRDVQSKLEPTDNDNNLGIDQVELQHMPKDLPKPLSELDGINKNNVNDELSNFNSQTVLQKQPIILVYMLLRCY